MKRNVIILRVVCLLLLAAIESYLYYHNRTYSKVEIEKMFAPITSKYGIKIVYEIREDFLSSLVSPGIPVGPSRDSKVTAIRHSVLANYPRILKRALGKYPVNVIKEHRYAIYFAEKIDQNGFNYGGSYDPFRRIL